MSDIEYSVITSDVIKSFDCITGLFDGVLSHLTKMAATPIYGKTKYVLL